MKSGPHISYMLPKSVSYPSLRKRSPRRAYEVVCAWLAETTEYRLDPTLKLSLTVPIADKAAGTVLSLLDQEYGPHLISGGTYAWPQEIQIAEFWAWELPHERIHALFDLVESNRVPFETYDYRIVVSVDFMLSDEKGRAVPGQSFAEPDRFHSNLLMILSVNSCVVPEIRFPFERDGEEFRKVYETFKATVPFRINDKYLRVDRVKNGRIISRKL